MKVRITRTDLESKPREYSIRGTSLAVVAMEALDRLRLAEMHALSVRVQDDGTVKIHQTPATYAVEEI